MKVTARNFGKVAVLMGGQSAEREISLLSGHAVLRALLDQNVDAQGIDAGADVLQQLSKGDFDRVFIVLHGRGGEDGVIQGALSTLELPFTGSGVLGSALGMDKYRCKQLWQGLGLPTPAYSMVKNEQALSLLDELSYPLIVKPAHEGSSIGISKVDAASQLSNAWKTAADYDETVLLESWIEGDEYSVSILGDQALPVIKLETAHVFYDYAAKYETGDTQYFLPCGLGKQQEQELQSLALSAFQAVDASGWGRVDFMLDQQQVPWLIEVNTVPGMTDHSLVPMAAKAAGISFDQLVWTILEQTLEANHG